MAIKYVCESCKKQVNYKYLPIQCDSCNGWFHGLCENLNRAQWEKLGKSQCDWLCKSCFNRTFPFWSLSDNDFESLFVNLNDNEKELLNRCMEFEKVNLDHNPFNYDRDDIDCGSEDRSTHYVTHNEMYKMCRIINDNFSCIHFNARSLVKNFENIESMLLLNEAKFAVIGISETWMTETHNKQYYTLPGYEVYFTNRTNKKGGGTAMYVRTDYTHECIKEGCYVIENCFEVTTVKVNIKKDKNVYVACIYRAPGTNVEFFTEKYLELLDKFKGKTMYICGDFNIDLMKYTMHTDTTKYIDSLYSYAMFPLIIKPTRFGDKSATLIDNIFTNDKCNTVKNYILIDDISDHLPVFTV